MKCKYHAIVIMMILGLVITICFIALTPEQIPLHYNATGEIDRYGSKYESLIMPAVIAVIGAAVIGVSKYFSKKGRRQNEEIALITGLALTAIFNALNLFILLKAAESIAFSNIDITQAAISLLGILLILLGNIMPKARRNTLFGLRTKWSMANDVVWQKSQRRGGFMTVICGVAMLLMGIVLNGVLLLAAVGALMAAWVTACVYATYDIYKKYKIEANKG